MTNEVIRSALLLHTVMRRIYLLVFFVGLLADSRLCAQWVHVGGPYGAIQSIAADGRDIFVGMGGNSYFRTTDAGITWTKSASPGAIRALAICAGRVIAASYEAGVFCSTDAGVTWSQIGSQFSGCGSASLIAKDSTLFLAGCMPGGVFRSTDFGTTWIRSVNGLGDTIVTSLAASDSGILAVTWSAVNRSTDMGLSWSFLDSARLASIPNFVTLGNDWFVAGQGVARSSDNGLSWANQSVGLRMADINTVAVCSNGHDLLALTRAGVFRSTDSGSTWEGAGVNPLEVAGFVAFGGKLFIGSSGGGVFASSDDGTTWSFADSGLTTRYDSYVRAILATEKYLFIGTDTGVFRSSDTGRTWTQFKVGSCEVVSLGQFGNRIFAGTGDGWIPCCGGTLFYSTDFGTTWDSVNSSLRGLVVYSFASERGFFFAVTDSGVFRSADSGITWEHLSYDFSNHTRLIGTDAGILYAGASGLLRSADDGDSWTAIGPAIPVRDMLLVGRSIFYTSDFYPMRRYDTNGSTGIVVDTGIDGIGGNWLGVGGNYLFAGGGLGGTFRRQLSEMMSVEREASASGFMIETNPNPFRMQTTIRFFLPHAGHASLSLFDMLGREIATLVDATLEAGEHTIDWDGSAATSGIYICRLQAVDSLESCAVVHSK